MYMCAYITYYSLGDEEDGGGEGFDQYSCSSEARDAVLLPSGGIKSDLLTPFYKPPNTSPRRETDISICVNTLPQDIYIYIYIHIDVYIHLLLNIYIFYK